MTKGEFITIYNELICKNTDGLELITKYCKECDKSDEDIKVLQLFILYNIDLFYYMLYYVINHYSNKFTICVLRDKNNNFIKIF